MNFLNMSNNIIELENKQEHINQLKAARYLYTKAGHYSTSYMIFCAFIPVGISIGRLFLSPDAQFALNVMMAYGLIALIAGFILESKIRKHRKLAAIIQQLFDSEVFELEWNSHLWGTKPSLENINDNMGNLPNKGFENWYDPLVNSFNKMKAILVCQRTNLVYDSKLRKRYISIIDYIAWSVFVLILIIGFYKNEGMQTAIVFIGVPLVPIIKWFFSTRRQNLEDIEACELLRSFVDNSLEELKKKDNVINEDTLCWIQDGIYRHRKTAFKIPDWLYSYMRNRQEKNTHTMVDQLAHR